MSEHQEPWWWRVFPHRYSGERYDPAIHERYDPAIHGATPPAGLNEPIHDEGSKMSESTDPAPVAPQEPAQAPLAPSQPPASGYPAPGWYDGRYFDGERWQDNATGRPAATPEPVPGHEGPQLPYVALAGEPDTAPVHDQADEPAYDGPGIGSPVVCKVGGGPAAGFVVNEPDENGSAAVLVYQRGVGFHEYALTYDTSTGEETPDGTFRELPR